MHDFVTATKSRTSSLWFLPPSILLITSMLVYELWVNSQLSRAKFGWMFFWTQRLGSGFR